MYKHGLLISALLLGAGTLSAQDLNEAFNLSNLTVQGTARSMGFGNALGSIGADFSTLSVNPAGIGIYRSSEATFTPALRINNASSDYLGSTTTDNNTRFGINNFGIVFASSANGRRRAKRAWKSVSFAFGMNKVADFNRNYTYQGVNRSSSATQAMESDANQYDVTTVNTPGYLGYQGFLIDPASAGTPPYHSVVPFSGGINQQKVIQEKGSISEYAFSFGGNYRDVLMLGATIGVPDVHYSANSYYSETKIPGNTASNPAGFQYYQYNQSLDITGVGFNLKLGAIYKITDYLRLGAAFHTPTIYGITDVYNPYLLSQFSSGATELSVSNGGLQTNQFDYSFVTPWRGVLSASFIIKKIGFITADYEYVNYAAMHYIYPTDPTTNNAAAESAINQDIKNTYKGASNFRIGAEALVTKYFMARAGFGYYGSPYKNNEDLAQRIDISGGVGFHFRHFFTDLALVHSFYKNQEYAYTVDYNFVVSGPPAPAPLASTRYASNNVAWTIGVKF
jgi:hypothetical protein